MPARLILEAGVAVPAVLELADGAEAFLGRDSANHLCLQDRHASRLHARIRHAAGRWLLDDQATMNGTRVDGRRIESARLEDNQLIAIGDVRLRFRLAGVPAQGASEEPHLPTLGLLENSDTTRFEADELSVLLRLLHGSLADPSPDGLISRALEAVVRQTGATLAAFLSLDPDRPEPRSVRPADAALDPRLSRHLTQAVLRTSATVWLGRGGPRRSGDSPSSPFHDALAVPLRGAGQAGDAPLGALHACRAGKAFTERQASFCEIVAALLATSLEATRGRRALEADLERLRDHTAAAYEMVGSSAAIGQVRGQVRRLADGPGPVLIVGETGVGKELAALGLHRQSARHAGPLVVVDCASLCGAAAEGQLFGTAPDGEARGRPGFFAQADMGT
ncbi:MAG: sigma 54-interacting transcriptional regulator, partial [Gemmataceae bacterium]|nr:sigma 54-interacting transcriptional regulator [Gemmataceae bacterium]